MQQKGDIDVQFFNQVHRHHQYPFLNITFTEANDFKQSIVQISYFEGEDDEIQQFIKRFIIDL